MMKVWQWLNPQRLYHRLMHLTPAEWNSLGLKALALVLAFLLFLIARQPLSEVRVVGVPVEFSGLRQGVELISDGVPQTVSVRLRGPRDMVHGLMPNQLSVLANLGDKEPGERVVQLHRRDVTRPDGIEVLQIEPASLKLLLEPTVHKLVKVEPQLLGALEEGLEVYRVTASPALLEIEGPQVQLKALTQVKTESVNLQGHRQSFNVAVDVELPHATLRLTKRMSVALNVEIGERRASRLFSHLPVQLNGQARPLTKTVEVLLLGPRAAIEALHESDLIVEFDVPPSNVNTARPRVRLPEKLAAQIEIKSINPSEIKVKK